MIKLIFIITNLAYIIFLFTTVYSCPQKKTGHPLFPRPCSSAQQGCIYLYRKKQAWFKKGGVSKMAKKYYFTNLLILS